MYISPNIFEIKNDTEEKSLYKGTFVWGSETLNVRLNDPSREPLLWTPPPTLPSS